MKLGKKHILVFLLGLFNLLSAQNFEWLKSYGNKNSESIIGLGVEKSGSTVSVLVHQCSPVNVGIDTLKLDSISYSLPYVSSMYTRSFIFRTDKNGKVIKEILDRFFRRKDNNDVQNALFQFKDLKKTPSTFEFLPYYSVLKLAIFSTRFLFNYCESIDDQIQNQLGYNDENLFGKMCSLSVLLPIKVKFESASVANPKNEICLKYTPIQCFNNQSSLFEPKLSQNFDYVYSSFMESLLVNFSKNIVCLACLDYLASYLFCFLGKVVNKILNYDHLELMNCLDSFKSKKVFFSLSLPTTVWKSEATRIRLAILGLCRASRWFTSRNCIGPAALFLVPRPCPLPRKIQKH
jgi:hypothetical protein